MKVISESVSGEKLSNGEKRKKSSKVGNTTAAAFWWSENTYFRIEVGKILYEFRKRKTRADMTPDEIKNLAGFLPVLPELVRTNKIVNAQEYDQKDMFHIRYTF